jgi:hypothetical protein
MTSMSKAAPALMWGVAGTGKYQHGFVESPSFPWRSFRPRSLCGQAWSPHRTPQPIDARPRCGRCERVAAALGFVKEVRP